MKKLYAGFFTCLFAFTVCFATPGCEGGGNAPPAEDNAADNVDADIDEEAEAELDAGGEGGEGEGDESAE